MIGRASGTCAQQHCHLRRRPDRYHAIAAGDEDDVRCRLRALLQTDGRSVQADSGLLTKVFVVHLVLSFRQAVQHGMLRFFIFAIAGL